MDNKSINESIIGDYVMIPNRKGQEECFEVLFAFLCEDNLNQYMMVSPLDKEGKGQQEGEQDVYAFRYREEEGRLVLFCVENDQEWDIIEEMFQMFLQKHQPAF